MLKTQALRTEKKPPQIHGDINADFPLDCQEASGETKNPGNSVYIVEQEHTGDKTVVELLREFLTLKMKSH